MSHLAQDEDYLRTLAVLYVEDDEDVRRQFDRFLRHRVGSLVVAGHGADGQEAFRAHKPHVVITDIKMPVMDGLTMAQEIRNRDRSVPVIVTTAFEQTDYLLRSINIGVDKYVTKPIDPDRLYAALLECGYRLCIEEQLKLAATVFDCCLEAILITDADNRIVSANRIFCEITGYELEEVLGETPSVLASGLHDQSFYENMWRELVAKGCWQYPGDGTDMETLIRNADCAMYQAKREGKNNYQLFSGRARS